MEICICAAVKTEEGVIIRCHRHSDGLMALLTKGLNRLKEPESQGFITSMNRYVNRSEARELQRAAGITSASKDGFISEVDLFSEDLY